MRALIKAGLSDLLTLRAATLEQLIAVPGMSEVKARHIQNYLGRFSEEDLRRAAAKQEEHRTNRQVPGTNGTRAQEGDSPAAAADGPTPAVENSPLSLPVERTLALALELLLSEPATGFRARLLRETVGFMRLARILTQLEPLAPKARERALRRLTAAAAALEQANDQPDMDRKEQTRLANELAQTSERLEALIGRTLRRGPLEAEDE